MCVCVCVCWAVCALVITCENIHEFSVQYAVSQYSRSRARHVEFEADSCLAETPLRIPSLLFSLSLILNRTYLSIHDIVAIKPRIARSV